MQPLGFNEYLAERSAATRRRQAGEPGPPWSTDPVIGTKKLCSVVRDHDRTSVLARRVVLASPAPELYALVFRWVNKAETLQAMVDAGFHLGRSVSWTTALLQGLDKPLNTNAYKINPPGGIWNLEGIARRMCQLANAGTLLRRLKASATVRELAGVTNALFISYQTMQDLRWVHGPYTDEGEWAFFGMGAVRGFQRLQGEYAAQHWRERGAASVTMRDLDSNMRIKLPELWAALPGMLAQAREAVGDPGLAMFEVEHNLCEYDKYLRYHTGEAGGASFKPRPNWPGVQ